MTQNLLRQSGHATNHAEMLRVADLVTNPSTEYTQQHRDAVIAMGLKHGDGSGAVTSADIRQIKMNYLQHNKNQIPNNGPIIAKNLDGKTSSQVALL